MSFVNNFRRVLASRKFFVFVVALLVFQALWVVFSFSYAMLWDEYYHFGLIQFYGQHLSPFITNQPASLDMYGAVERSPKYLYHWLMSFPFRLTTIFTASETAQIIILRIVNIALFAGGLVAYRAAMLRITKSKALVHFGLLILVLLPLSSLLAAHINYDNLVFLMTGLIVYWALRFIQAKRFEIKWLALVVGAGLLTCVVKLAFAPILAATLAFLTYWICRNYGKAVFGMAKQSFRALGKWSRVGLVALLLLGVGFSAERFGINFVKYGGLNPKCDKVLSVERCMSFSPYKVEHNGAQDLPPAGSLEGPLDFTLTTWPDELYHQYFTSGTRLAPEYYTVPEPLVVPYWTMAVAGFVALGGFLLTSPKLLRRPEIQLSLLCIFMLGAALWATNYSTYMRVGFPFAIQGRYLLPIVPLVLVMAGLAVSMVLRWRKLKAALAALTLIGLLYGGGLLTHLFASTPDWYWPNQTVVQVNDTTSRFLDNLPGFYKINQ